MSYSNHHTSTPMPLTNFLRQVSQADLTRVQFEIDLLNRRVSALERQAKPVDQIDAKGLRLQVIDEVIAELRGLESLFVENSASLIVLNACRTKVFDLKSKFQTA